MTTDYETEDQFLSVTPIDCVLVWRGPISNRPVLEVAT
jgi:hypothetical protein